PGEHLVAGKVNRPTDTRRQTRVDERAHPLVEVPERPHRDLEELGFALVAEQLGDLLWRDRRVRQVIVGVKSDRAPTDDSPEDWAARAVLVVDKLPGFQRFL